jgi:hypothetical protein
MEVRNLIHAVVTSIPGKELSTPLYEYRRPSGSNEGLCIGLRHSEIHLPVIFHSSFH